METRGRKAFKGKKKDYGTPPEGWRAKFTGRYVPACQGTEEPYWCKEHKSWMLIAWDSLDKCHLIYMFSEDTFKYVIYSE